MDTPARRGGGPPEPRQGPGWGGGPWDWDPLAELRRPRGDTGRAEDRGTTPAWGGVAWGPVVEEDETDDAYEIRARLPGVPRERISVDVDEQELRISGELGEEERARALSRRGGRFLYRTTLPTGADPERAEADLADGVLRVRLPKSATPKRRRLRIGGTDRETEQLREQPREQPTERPTEQPTEQSMGQATARAADRSMDRTGADT